MTFNHENINENLTPVVLLFTCKYYVLNMFCTNNHMFYVSYGTYKFYYDKLCINKLQEENVQCFFRTFRQQLSKSDFNIYDVDLTR